MITFPREFPTGLKIETFRLTLDVNDTSFQGEISRKVNIQSHGAGTTDRWTGEISTNNLRKTDWSNLTGWIASLKGRQGTFLVHDPDRLFPQNFVNNSPTADSTDVTADSTLFTADAKDFPGSGLVNGASQMGTSLITSGWPFTSSTPLKIGDMFQVEAQLYILTEDAIVDSIGEVTLQFEPAIRTPPADNAVIKTVKPQMVARRISNTIPWQAEVVAFTSITFGFEEVL